MLGNITEVCMGYIHQVMNEEHRRLQDLSKKYREKIGSYPQGAVSIKKRRDQEYLYLAKRKDGKVRFDYIGSIVSDKAKDILARIEARKQYELKLKQVNRDLKEIGKIIHGRKL